MAVFGELKLLEKQADLLRAHCSRILRAIEDPVKFGAELYSKKLLSDLEWKNVLSSQIPFSDKVCMMLDYVRSRLGMVPTAFDTFLQVLMTEPVTACIAKDIQQALLDQDDKYLDESVSQSITRQRDAHSSVDLEAPASKRVCTLSSILDCFTSEEDLQPTSTSDIKQTSGLSSDTTNTGDEGQSSSDTIIAEMMSMLDRDEHSQVMDDQTQTVEAIPQSLSLIQPTGALTKKIHTQLYTKLFRMAWNGQDKQALSFVRLLRKQQSVAIDLKVVCMEVVHTVNNERDLKMLLSALAYTDRAECENKTLLKCRLHRRIAGLHYRSGDLEEANEHLVTALQLAEHLSPDIDTVYTLRLNALMLFEKYKEGDDEKARRGAEKYFQKAMDHVRKQSDSKRLVTERIKISKAKFHLDMMTIFKEKHKSEDAIEQLEYRARDTLEDVDETYLTEGDQAFFYSAQAQLKLCDQTEWNQAMKLASKSVEMHKRCGLENSFANKEAMNVIKTVQQSSSDA